VTSLFTSRSRTNPRKVTGNGIILEQNMSADVLEVIGYQSSTHGEYETYLIAYYDLVNSQFIELDRQGTDIFLYFPYSLINDTLYTNKQGILLLLLPEELL
jgi:hypothetical protein